MLPNDKLIELLERISKSMQNRQRSSDSQGLGICCRGSLQRRRLVAARNLSKNLLRVALHR